MAFGMLANLDGFEAFNFKIVFSWFWFAIGTAMIIMVIFFVSWRTLRYVERINIADVIRERST
jgi:ABC-type antimicrobial peptide transport system permease subunit